MNLNRRSVYRFPWTMTDNPGGWIEVTDKCNLRCPGCYRLRLTGHRPLEDVKKDIRLLVGTTNCDSIAIAGGEPLIYPEIVEVVGFIANLGIKPLLITNGVTLTEDLAIELKNAGLMKYNFHIDSAQNRPGWEGKNEVELNDLRQEYADMIKRIGKVQCGFNITVFRSTLEYIPEIVKWCRRNIDRVHHLSLIALRGLLVDGSIEYRAWGRRINPSELPNTFTNKNDITITSEEMFDVIQSELPDIKPAAYLNGTTKFESNKYLVYVHIGNVKKIFGVAGSKAIEIAQVFHHMFKGRYSAFSKSPKVGRKIFLLSIFDSEIRKAFGRFLKTVLANPLRFFSPIYSQPVVFEQPLEFIDSKKNLCDGCINMMIHDGKLIQSCRLDEYRVFGGNVHAFKLDNAVSVKRKK